MQPSADDAAQLQAYMADQGNQTIVQQDTTGNPEVCVIDPVSGQMAYYRHNDGLENYLLMSMLTNHVHPLIGMGVVSGDIDLPTALAFNHLLVDVNSHGQLYQPYRSVNGAWEPSTTVIVQHNHPLVVHNVYYGNPRTTKPRSYASALKSSPPAGFTISRATRPNDQVASLQRDPSGKLKTTTLPGVSATSVIKNGGRIPTVTGKTGSTFSSQAPLPTISPRTPTVPTARPNPRSSTTIKIPTQPPSRLKAPSRAPVRTRSS